MGPDIDPTIKEALEDIQRARDTLSRDIQIYVGRHAEETWSNLRPSISDLQLGERISTLVEYGQHLQQVIPTTPLSKFGDFEAIYQDARSVIKDRSKLRKADEDWWLVNSANWLCGHLAKEFKSPAEPSIETLTSRAKALHEVTEMWTIYCVAWEQRQEDSLLRRAVRVGDRVARHFYDVVEEKNLDLHVEHQWLITLLYLNRLFTRPSLLPTPYIVGPYWGYEEAWNGLSYAHEVGHHVYRNVKGLSDELLVNLMLTLGSQGHKRSVLRVWCGWLEETFADIFALLRVGPAMVHSAKRLALWVSPALGRAPTLADSDSPAPLLLCAHDESHPCTYLRIRLSLEVLKMLAGDKVPMVQKLEEGWEQLAHHPKYVYTQEQGVPKRRWLKDIQEPATSTLQTLLESPLYALAAKDDLNTPRTVREVFYDGCDCDEDAIRKAQEAFANNQPATDVEIRHILAAAEFSLDDPGIRGSLENLHELVLDSIDPGSIARAD
jgi:hypothetical protein